MFPITKKLELSAEDIARMFDNADFRGKSAMLSEILFWLDCLDDEDMTITIEKMNKKSRRVLTRAESINKEIGDDSSQA